MRRKTKIFRHLYETMIMQRSKKLLVLILLISFSCLEPYSPPVIKDSPDLLVVDAFLNSTEGVARVRLSRTVSLSSAEKPPAESQAKVTIEDEQGNMFQLEETGSGQYQAVGLSVNPATRYRLTIQTINQRKYTSDFISVKQTPSIDSINWTLGRDGLNINVNTHDATGATRYYRWDYTETWEYTSMHYAAYKMENGKPVSLPVDQSPYRCWKTELATRILIGSTSRLAQDRVSNFILLTIPGDSYRLSVKYSILVRQYALTEEAFTYWLNVQKNTESLGGLFDPLPSQVEGNIYSVNDPDDFVIGFFSGGSVVEKRIFLRANDLPDKFSTFRHPFCPMDTVLKEDVPSLVNETLLIAPILNPDIGFDTLGYFNAEMRCKDCRSLGGGVTTKPDFWD